MITRGRIFPWLLAASVVALGGCRTRLPVDRPGVEPSSLLASEPTAAPKPMPRATSGLVSRWREAMKEAADESEHASRFEFELSPDRLADLVRYDPDRGPPGGLLGFVLAVDVCLPAHHPSFRR